MTRNGAKPPTHFELRAGNLPKAHAKIGTGAKRDQVSRLRTCRMDP